ncbi:hypothetical protein [Actinophytocola sp.]|uniref:hypothetical protein n=1 Tax=Actinophytocola sp. TaxID=1872138 RepID=UPI002D803084|nr:hypothetical protein [Actinophytocola sp.]HET9142563.1 hypothetical protein [Actinophytocola sp.]
MDHSQSDTCPESRDSEWVARVRSAASADVRQMLRAERRRKHERWIIGSVALVAAVLVLVLLGQIGVSRGSRSPESAPAPSVEAALRQVDPARPFAGTPAADWPDGAAGIQLPDPVATGGFTAPEVATALAQVRDLLVTSRLDPTLVVRHDPGRFLAAFAPDARRQLEPLFGSGQEARAQALVSLVADGTTLLPVAPKVTGRMRVTAGAQPGELVVHTNYVFVYPFRTDTPAEVDDPMDILVVVRAQVDYVLRRGERWTEGSQGWWYDAVAGYAYSIGCDAYRRGFLAPVLTERKTTSPGPDRAAYFNPDGPLPQASGC